MVPGEWLNHCQAPFGEGLVALGLGNQTVKNQTKTKNPRRFLLPVISNAAQDLLSLAAQGCFRRNLDRIGEGTYTKTMSPLLEYAGMALAMVENP